jgi:HEPN domain-containing protein
LLDVQLRERNDTTLRSGILKLMQDAYHEGQDDQRLTQHEDYELQEKRLIVTRLLSCCYQHNPRPGEDDIKHAIKMANKIIETVK